MILWWFLPYINMNWPQVYMCPLQPEAPSHLPLFRSLRPRTSLVAQTVKRLPTMQETRVQSLCWEDLLEKEMEIHSSILAWKIPWTEESGRLQSMGSQRVGHDWVISLSLSFKAYKVTFEFCLWSDHSVQAIFRQSYKGQRSCHGLKKKQSIFISFRKSWEPMLDKDLNCVWKPHECGSV